MAYWDGELRKSGIASQKHIEGTVINGICRDVSRSLELEYPVYSKGKFMRKINLI